MNRTEIVMICCTLAILIGMAACTCVLRNRLSAIGRALFAIDERALVLPR